jgi:hypothetical protein
MNMRLPVFLLVMGLCCCRLNAQQASTGAFNGASLDSGLLRLAAAEQYLSLKEDARKTAVEAQAKAYPGAALAVVEYQGNGELWTLSNGQATQADSWSRRQLRFTRHERKAGRWFGYIGGQFVRGGDLPSNGWTGRIGTTLFHDRYDTALSVSHNSMTEIDDSGSTTIGVTARALYPYTKHAGFNLGLELDRTSYTGYNHISPSAIGGINIYLPGGSFDVSLLYGEEGRTSLQAGYTVYISK